MKILIAGWQKMSLIDYPGGVSCVVFLAGCNMRCHYCHNSKLFHTKENKIPFDEVKEYLKANEKMLDAIVISGGEPTINPTLIDIIYEVRKNFLNLKIKLDTNGVNFPLLERLVNEKLIDYVAMDIKSPAYKYRAFTGIWDVNILNSANLLKENRVPYMFRTTLSPFLTKTDIFGMGMEFIEGAETWQLQQFIPNEYSSSHKIVGLPRTKKDIDEFAEIASRFAKNVLVKGL
ncbi:MAG: anaerobic ribonucleoside-triphosphate reductase activating protein [Christensenellaceae bacterium]|nr:anaerobic ribonucleoside-triphosphate reductase activating protein [Christensenellaceae bacterium]